MKTWADYTKEEKIAFLHSQRRDLVRQMKQEVHTSRSSGCGRMIDKVDKQLAELED